MTRLIERSRHRKQFELRHLASRFAARVLDGVRNAGVREAVPEPVAVPVSRAHHPGGRR
jgi:hypothetical protein